MKMKNILKDKLNKIKLCAVFTAVCFMVTTVGSNLHAIPMFKEDNKKYEEVFNKSSVILENGKITASKDVNSDVTVVNIQDLHCHPQTQKNISKIIGQLVRGYKVQRVYVEGGYGDIDTSWMDKIKDEKVKRKVIEKLLEEGILTGSEYYKLTNEKSLVELKGLDEERTHKDNLKRLAWIISKQEKYKGVTREIDTEIKLLEKRYINNKNKKFNKDIEQYTSGKQDARRFYRQLIKYAKDINKNPQKYNNITAIKLERYPNIVKYMALTKKSKGMDIREVTIQLKQLILELKTRIPYYVYAKLAKETDKFRDGDRVIDLVSSLSKKANINLEGRYKELKTFLETRRINKGINPIKLVQEERELIGQIRVALSYNNEEYEIMYMVDFNQYFKDYLGYKLTEADWQYFEKGFNKFKKIYEKYATVSGIKDIEEDIEELNKYYLVNDRRTVIFVEKLLSDVEVGKIDVVKKRQEEEILKGSKEVIVAVTGGFHSVALEKMLASKGVNTIVITPNIYEGTEKSTKKYKEIIEEQSRKIEHQALAYTIMSSMSNENNSDNKILLSIIKDLVDNDEILLEDLHKLIGINKDELKKALENLNEKEGIKQERKKEIFDAINLAVKEIIDEFKFPGKEINLENRLFNYEEIKGTIDETINNNMEKIFPKIYSNISNIAEQFTEQFTKKLLEARVEQQKAKVVESLVKRLKNVGKLNLEKKLEKVLDKKTDIEKAKTLLILNEFLNEGGILNTLIDIDILVSDDIGDEKLVDACLVVAGNLILSQNNEPLTDDEIMQNMMQGIIEKVNGNEDKEEEIGKEDLKDKNKVWYYYIDTDIFMNFITNPKVKATIVSLSGNRYISVTKKEKKYIVKFFNTKSKNETEYDDEESLKKALNRTSIDGKIGILSTNKNLNKNLIEQKNIIKFSAVGIEEPEKNLIKSDKDEIDKLIQALIEKLNVKNKIEEVKGKLKDALSNNKDVSNQKEEQQKNKKIIEKLKILNNFLKQGGILDNSAVYALKSALNKNDDQGFEELQLNVFMETIKQYHIDEIEKNIKDRKFMILPSLSVINEILKKYNKKTVEFEEQINNLINIKYEESAIVWDRANRQYITIKKKTEDSYSVTNTKEEKIYTKQDLINILNQCGRCLIVSNVAKRFETEGTKLNIILRVIFLELFLLKVGPIVLITLCLFNVIHLQAYIGFIIFAVLQILYYGRYFFVNKKMMTKLFIERSGVIHSAILLIMFFILILPLKMSIISFYIYIIFCILISAILLSVKTINKYGTEINIKNNLERFREFYPLYKKSYGHLKHIMQNFDIEIKIDQNRFLTHREFFNFLETVTDDQINNIFKDVTNFKEVQLKIMNLSEVRKKEIKQLSDKLDILEINTLATENDYLVFKVFFNEYFNKNNKIREFINSSAEKYDTEQIVTKYYCAMAVARFIYDSIGKIPKDIDTETLNNIIIKATDAYLTALDYAENIILLDNNTKFFILLNDEGQDLFNEQALKQIANSISDSIEDANFNTFKGRDAAKLWLNKIKNFSSNNGEKGYFCFVGHGHKKKLDVVSNAEQILVKELADALITASKKTDLRNITIDLSTCSSYYFARNLYKELKKREVQTFPTIITEAGLETPLGITIVRPTQFIDSLDKPVGNLHFGILRALLQVKSKSSLNLTKLTMKELALMEPGFTRSNSTMFLSFTEKQNQILKRYKNEIINIYEKQLYVYNTKIKDISLLPKKVHELSIFSPVKDNNKFVKFLHKTAPVWEELVFRTLPLALLITGVLSPGIGIALFLIMQIVFIFSHTIVKWITQKDTGKTKLADILKEDFKKLSLPTFLISIPYIVFIILSFIVSISTITIPILTIVPTIVSIISHWLYNEKKHLLIFIPFIVFICILLIVPKLIIAIPLSLLTIAITILMILHWIYNKKAQEKLSIVYSFIKPEEIEGKIKEFKILTNESNEYGLTSIPVFVAENIGQINKKYELKDIGIKVNGKSIYKTEVKGQLIYGAEGVSKEEVINVLANSCKTKEDIKEITGKEVEAGGQCVVIDDKIEEKEGVVFEEGLIRISKKAVENKSAEYVQEYIMSVMEIARARGIMYSQKAVISLEKIKDKEKLRQAIENGKVRKIISKKQYDDLQMSKEEIIRMREDGIYIYIEEAGNNIKQEEYQKGYKEAGISGYIRKEKGKIYMYDYYNQEEIEMEVISGQESIGQIEQKMVNSQKPIYMDIQILEEKFNKERDITTIHRQFEALAGKIKIKTRLWELKEKDVENVVNNIDYTKLPILDGIKKEDFIKLELEGIIKELGIKGNSEIAILSKSIKDEKIKRSFAKILKERILAKTELERNNKKYGLKDKKLEQLLGEMLVMQIQNKDKETVEIGDNFKYDKEGIINEILRERQKIEQCEKKKEILEKGVSEEEKGKIEKEKEVAINTIIELILIYGDAQVKENRRETDMGNIKEYRAMLCAA